MSTKISIHGNAVSFSESPGNCEQVSGIGWTDIVGLRQGWGTTFRGKSNTFIWFHYSTLTLSLVDQVHLALSSLSVLFDVSGTATVQNVHLWNNNGERIFTMDGLNERADFTFATPSPLSAASDIGVSIGVLFQDAANITFRGLMTEFVTTTAPRPDLHASFNGTATLRTDNGNAPGPFSSGISLPLNFNGARTVVRIESFTPIEVGPFPVSHPLEGDINVITTVTLVRSSPGSYNSSTGELGISITLRLSHRNAANGNAIFGADPSEIDLFLTTDLPDGRPIDPSTGAVALSGSSSFRNGFLNGSNGNLVINGTITPSP